MRKKETEAIKEEILFQYPAGCENADEFCELWANILGGPREELIERIRSVLAGVMPEAEFGEDDGAPVDIASEHYWFLASLRHLIDSAPVDRPVTLPAPADVSSNPLARLARSGHAFARALYEQTGFEYQWPALMNDDPDLLCDALSFVQMIGDRYNVSNTSQLADALRFCFDPNWRGAVTGYYRSNVQWVPFVRFWRRIHGLGAA